MLEVDLKDDDQMGQLEYTLWITNIEVNIYTTYSIYNNASSPQGIENTQNKSRVGRNPKHKLPGLHPNIHGRIKNGGESRMRSSYPRRFDCQDLFQSLILKPKQLTQLSR
jgi:hypothetical protein